jgi:hypothetical protein
MTLTAYELQIRQENALFIDSLTNDEKGARMKGTFFSSFESVCDLDRQGVVASNFPTIGRDKTQGALIYPTTANEEYLERCSVAASSSSDTTNTEQKLTTVDFLFNLKGEKAHLLSNAQLCHVAYTKIAQAATGHYDVDFQKRRKLLNGMQGKGRRLTDSGIKHSKYNKIHLLLQKQLLDTTPPVLIIVPLLPLPKIRNWHGTPFDAMVLPCGEDAQNAAKLVLQNVRCCCNEDETIIGIEVLHYFVKDIAELLLHDDLDVMEDVNKTEAGSSHDTSILNWKILVHELRGNQPSIQVPILKTKLKWETVKVAKGTFDLKFSCLLDPFLLAVKGAINFSSLVGTKLMPACPLDDPDSDLDYSDSEV